MLSGNVNCDSALKGFLLTVMGDINASVHSMYLGSKISGKEHDKNNGSCAFSIVS